MTILVCEARFVISQFSIHSELKISKRCAFAYHFNLNWWCTAF